MMTASVCSAAHHQFQFIYPSNSRFYSICINNNNNTRYSKSLLLLHCASSSSISPPPSTSTSKPKRKNSTTTTSTDPDSASASSSSPSTIKKKRGRKPKPQLLIPQQNLFTTTTTTTTSTDPDSACANDDDKDDLHLNLHDQDDDISFLYGWPPLICCFGAAYHAFLPSARPANRLVDYEILNRMRDSLWTPDKYFRAPGGCAGSVALALSTLGAKVAFMGKLGDDHYGQTMLYYLNVNKVQTRSVSVDSKRSTAVSHMKMTKRGALKMTCVKPSAEDYLSKSEINIHVLKEAKMFYFNTSSLLERNMRSTALQAIKISKKLGGVIFYDLNLPMPLWESREETKEFIQKAWNSADIIEVTKQELEFLCGITPNERFDTEDNDKSKFVHYDPEVIAQLWHPNLKVLFVTNGTSKVHYYTEEHNGAVSGMEAAPITAFAADMSASGDGIVAGLMRMLSVQPDLMTDKGYLEHSIKYAIDCGVIDQWLLARKRGFPPPEDVEEDIVVPDINGIKSLTEKEFRTLADEELESFEMQL